MKFSRHWAMPDPETFSIACIKGFVTRHLLQSRVSVDPFARNKRLATYTNDLNPLTAADSHVDAEDFVRTLHSRGVVADLVIFDPPYSPKQISECYQGVGREVGMKGTQNGVLYDRVRTAIELICAPQAVVLSFGWNSVGMGKGRGFELEEVMLVCHGGAHNDTICLAERKVVDTQQRLFP